MIYDKYVGMIRGKLESANKIYTQLAYKKVGELSDIGCFETKEKLHSAVPQSGYKQVTGPFRWGGEWDNIWLRGSYTVPAELAGKAIYVMPKTGAVEILCFRDGKPFGIINSKGEDILNGNHAVTQLTGGAKAGTVFDVALECYAGHFCAGCGPYESYGVNSASDSEFIRSYESVDICVRDDDVFGFVFDLKAVMQLSEYLDDASAVKAEARNVLEKVLSELILYPAHYSEEVWHASVVRCREIMKPILERSGADPKRGFVGIIGHSHMDTAWLWPYPETIRKCARTYANALALMDQDPDYKFIQSSALHADWMRQYYPDIFEGIKKRTAEGRYEPNGGVWIECDCNVTGGEAMVRQFLYGQRFTREYLDYTSDAFWLPDTFGYSAAIPQIMLGCDVKYFYTTKMSWNDLNEFPFDTFMWKGLDGSAVLTHLNITHTFPDVKNVIQAAKSPLDKQAFDGRLLAFGFGDGGGGPTMGMVEDANRSRGVPGLPQVEYTTISDFMKYVEGHHGELPVYNGELYLELHRGTLTQMHDIKRNNRKAEFAMRDLEYMSVLTGSFDKERIDWLYKELLRNQFHDILPGSALTEANDQAREEVTAVISEATSTAKADAALLTEGTDSVTVFNTTGFARSDIILEGKASIEGAASQTYTDVAGREFTAVSGVCVPAFGAVSLKKGAAIDKPSPFSCCGDTLDTPYYTVKFAENGAIASLVDKKTCREIRAEGGYELGTFWFGEDVPAYWDDWNIDSDTLRLKMKPDMRLVSRETVADGAAEYRIRSEYKVGQYSSVKIDTVFYASSPRIDFQALVDWKDKHSLLKVGFDVNVMSQTVKNEIQFGYVVRPTTRNNSIETAKFEVVNHKYSDVSESRYGVALLNDCKYGLSQDAIDGGVSLKLTLHKGGTRPDVTGDEGLHEMTWALLPHQGAFSVPTVLSEAYLLNDPMIAADGALKSELSPIISLSADNIVAEAIKPAEYGRKAYVVRLYEAEHNRTLCTASFGCAKRVFETNMLEEEKSELGIKDGKVCLEFRPFEIKTILVEY